MEGEQLKVLWLVNVALPEASTLMQEKETPFGGWLVKTSEYMANFKQIELIIAFPKRKISDTLAFKGEKIQYVAFPEIKYRGTNMEFTNVYLEKILDEFDPDLVHIFGTEKVQSLAMVNSCRKKKIKSVVSIQGLVSVYEKHYMASLPYKIQKRYTLRDLLRSDNLVNQQKKFTENGVFEINAIERSENVIGRTTWDRACTHQINPHINYYFCNESLRNSFYNNIWDFSYCEEYSIFTSQASYPIKGVHFLIEALPLILKKYPKTKLYIAGNKIVKPGKFTEKVKMSSYSQYIYDLIKKYSLEENIVFTGTLSEKEMCERYLKSNVFVLPSAIENSPNSLGESMILGVPSVASFVGGTPDMLNQGEEGFLYQYDAPYMLAHYVCKIFGERKVSEKLSRNARARALKTHDVAKNTNVLLEIYSRIIMN